MKNRLMERLETQFYHYTERYDANILALFKERQIDIDIQILEDILFEAKRRGVF